MTPPINSVSDERLAEMLAGLTGNDAHATKVPLPSEMLAALTELAARRAANTPVDGVMTVVDPDQWEPCSPSYLERGGKCDAPRVWNAAEQNHWHPRLSASPALPSQVAGEIPRPYRELAIWTNEVLAAYDERIAKGGMPNAIEGLRAAYGATSCITSPAAEPVGEAGSMPGTEGFTMAAFKASEVPIGTKLYTHPAPSASREVTDSGLAQRLNNAASIIEQWDAWEIGAANKPTVRLTVSASKLLREAAAALTLPERGM